MNNSRHKLKKVSRRKDNEHFENSENYVSTSDIFDNVRMKTKSRLDTSQKHIYALSPRKPSGGFSPINNSSTRINQNFVMAPGLKEDPNSSMFDPSRRSAKPAATRTKLAYLSPAQ